MFARSPVGEPMPLEPLKNGQRAARHAATTPLRVPAPSLASTPPALCASSAAKRRFPPTLRPAMQRRLPAAGRPSRDTKPTWCECERDRGGG
jgi:hypothetical protein